MVKPSRHIKSARLTGKMSFWIHRTARRKENILTVVFNSKYSKNLNTLLFLLSNKMLVVRAENYIMLVRIANREDTNQTALEEAV